MFGRKKARNVNQAAHAALEAERTVRTAKAAKLRGLRLGKEAMSPAEKTKAQRNSWAERMKSTPSV